MEKSKQATVEQRCGEMRRVADAYAEDKNAEMSSAWRGKAKDCDSYARLDRLAQPLAD